MIRPVPSMLAVALLACGIVPAALSIASPSLIFIALALDGAVLVLCAVDYLLAPRTNDLRVERQVADVLSSGVWNRVALRVQLVQGDKPVRGELRDEAPAALDVEGHRQSFLVTAREREVTLSYRVRPPTRGDAAFGDLHLRLWGPLGLCARQGRIAAARGVKIYPDLTALTREALELARANDAPSERTLRKPSEGSEFESFREYRPGDDHRTIDQKATARRGKTMVRTYQPERNQPVLLLIDCGRHMAGIAGERRKLDHAVDAALRLSKVCLDKGDLVGVVAFASDVMTHLPPRKGADHLRALTGALYRMEAALEESDYGAALDLAFARHHRRTLVVLFTDLQDKDTSASLLARVMRLRPRHLPMVVSLLDEDLQRAAQQSPQDLHGAYVRQVAARLEDEHRRTTAHLRNAGALAVRAAPSAFSAAAVNEYLRVKARGLL